VWQLGWDCESQLLQTLSSTFRKPPVQHFAKDLQPAEVCKDDVKNVYPQMFCIETIAPE
jgi:hypothetical protein